ncbi:MAG TPA: hypothetical protein VF887_01600 [Gemmatimonadaceae bacterium]
MMNRRAITLLLSLVSGVAACRQAPEAKAAQLRAVVTARNQELAHRVAIADANPATTPPLAMWIVPPELREISGLTLTARGTLLAHDDNVGRVYEIDPRTGVMLKRFMLSGDPKGDFEAITTVGTDIYLLESNGKLYRFKEAADGQEAPYTRYDTHLGHECQFESMTYEPDSTRLVLVCKKVADKNLRHELVIYRLTLPVTDATTPSMITIPMKEVIGANKWPTFRPSDITIDPLTGNYVLIASKEKALAVITPQGEVVRSEPLPPGHDQAEGVTITRDSILIVSDEATHRPADITLYRWHSDEPSKTAR